MFGLCFLIFKFCILLYLPNLNESNNFYTGDNLDVAPSEITKVHVIFMNHLDVGYSDYFAKKVGFSANVINTYFKTFFPRAIKIANQMRKEGYVENFRYTTHPWLIYFYLNCPVGLRLANVLIECPGANETLTMIEAIKQRDIVWHDGPMNMNYENLNSFGLKVAVNVSYNLNKMFKINKPMRVLSIRDVPGVSQGVIRTLRQNDFVAITSGVNSGSAPPAVPSLSRWQTPFKYPHEKEAPEIIYMQDPFGYPDVPGPYPNKPGGMAVKHCHQAPNTTEVLCFMFRTDNWGPPEKISEVLNSYEILRAHFVNAHLTASTFEDFFALVWKNRAFLPTVDKELGDTWIQGTASDPKKFARFRAMQRTFQYYYEMGYPITSTVVDASQFMIKPAEHTYGLNSVNDNVNWNNVDFEKVRSKKGFTDEELSWVEQRQYEELVLRILGPNHILSNWIQKAFKELESFDGKTESLKEVKLKKSLEKEGIYNFTCSNKTHSINVGFQSGAIVYLDTQDVIVNPSNPLGKLLYRTYNESDTDYFLKYYRTYWNTGYGKPNSTIYAKPESKFWPLLMRNIYRSLEKDCGFIAVLSAEDSTASTYYGLPASIMVLWDINISNNEMATEIYWDNKTPTRLMEAVLFSFQPQPKDPANNWYFSKMGEIINPKNVIYNGSQWQHNVDDSGIKLAISPTSNPIFQVIPWDTGITCPITKNYGPTVWPAPLDPINEKLTGAAFNIINNVWNTNYVYWYPFHGVGTENDAKFKSRYSLNIKFAPRKISQVKKHINNDNGDVLMFIPYH